MSNKEDQNKPTPKQNPEPKPQRIPFERKDAPNPLNVPGRKTEDPYRGGGRPPSKREE